jgi:hypothetical protein
MRLSSLAYGIVCMNKRVSFITDEVWRQSMSAYLICLILIYIYVSDLQTVSCLLKVSPNKIHGAIFLVESFIVFNNHTVCLKCPVPL